MSSEKVLRAEEDQTLLDEWPQLSDGTEWDGTGLLALLSTGRSPFGDALDVKALIREIEYYISSDIADIPIVTYGANHFVRIFLRLVHAMVPLIQLQGFYFRLRDGRHIVARVSRGDMNRSGFHGKAMEEQIMHDHFELDVYDALFPLGPPFSCRPLYHRDPVKSDGSMLTPNQGRRLFLFEKAGGETYHYVPWRALNARQKVRHVVDLGRLATNEAHSLPCLSDPPVQPPLSSGTGFPRSFVPTRCGNAAWAEPTTRGPFPSNRPGNSASLSFRPRLKPRLDSAVPLLTQRKGTIP